jgi:DNA-binding response OmpR family regulator
MPEVSGYELCEYVKKNGGGPVFLTAGAVEPVDEKEVDRVRADGLLKKPFEASLLLEAIGRFAGGTKKRSAGTTSATVQRRAGPPRAVVVIDPDQVRAAVTVALDAAMPAMVDEITAKVLEAFSMPGKAIKASE